MSKQSFKTINFRSDSLERIAQCEKIVVDYLGQGLKLTLRQLFYQLVIKNIIPNVEKSYKNLSTLVSDARLAGLLDWDAIEDRVRVPKAPSEFKDLGELVDAAIASYRLPRWRDQANYVELWVEKDALAGVLWPLACEYHVTMVVNRGYSSQSAMYEAAQRFMHRCNDLVTPILLYLGDHDPSGEDMVRDIRDRLVMFGVYGISVEKVALTMEQVEKYAPPPNPAKVSDPRAGNYIARHGASSWEVDALPPEVLAELIRSVMLQYVDLKKMQKIKRKEEDDKTTLRSFVGELT
jgi:hypothetical protein